VNTKNLALIIVFTALTLAINLAGPKIPAPYAPFLIYQLWEIPIVFTFLALGVLAGLIVTGINTLILTVYFPGFLPTGPLYNLFAILAMMLGVFIPYLISTRGCKKENLSTYLWQHIKMITISSTVLGIIFRVGMTSATNYFLLQQSPPIGLSYPADAALTFLPLSILFNATVALYTIPIAIAITAAVTSKIKIN
jgi:riboflavin transporter FmnP